MLTNPSPIHQFLPASSNNSENLYTIYNIQYNAFITFVAQLQFKPIASKRPFHSKSIVFRVLNPVVDATHIAKMAVHDVAPGYITLESRVASYRYAQPITGRRTSTAGTKAPKSLKWPHKFLLPEQV